MSEKLILVDAASIYFRAFKSLEPEYNSKGQPISALRALGEFAKLKPKAIYAFEGKDSRAWRRTVLPSYKTNRPPMDEDLKKQIPLLKPLLDKIRVKHITAPDGFEADDLIADTATGNQKPVVIVSSDKDFIQIIPDDVEDKKIQLWCPLKKIFKDANYCISLFGVKPSEFLYFQSLAGDSADGIPGIPGIGLVAALKIMKETDNKPENLEANWDWMAEKFPKLKHEDAVTNWVASGKCARLGVR